MPPKQVRYRLPADLADQIPERRLQRPVASSMNGDRLESANVSRDLHRVLADEQVDEGLEAVHGVAGTDTNQPLVGLDPDDRRFDEAPRDGIPGGEKRRIQLQPQTLQADRGDLHAGAGRGGKNGFQA